jgi:hypothetical protein
MIFPASPAFFGLSCSPDRMKKGCSHKSASLNHL